MKLVWSILKGILLTYTVLFSIVGTAIIVYAGVRVARPVLRVRSLARENPVETLYMAHPGQGLPHGDSILHHYVPLDSVSRHLINAVLAAEDDGFYTHPGFDLSAIAKAFDHNRSGRGRIMGASTLTQQMAKNLFVGGDKSYSRKYRELLYALLMEAMLGKDRILELYLNYARWGKSVFGCEAAARMYFGQSAAQLSLDQSTRMAAVLAMPARLNPHYTKSAYLQKRVLVIANNLYRRKHIGDSAYTALTSICGLPGDSAIGIPPAPLPGSVTPHLTDAASDRFD